MNIRYLFYFFLLHGCLMAQEFSFFPQKSIACNSLTTKLINTSSDTTNYTFEWKWRDQASILVSNVNVDFPVGTHEITLTVKDLDGTIVATIADTVVVHSNPYVEITADKTSTCTQEDIRFSIDSILSESEIIKYQWIFGDGTSSSSEIPNPHSYITAKTYNTSLSVVDKNGCASGESKSVTITISNSKPTAAFTMDNSKTCNDELAVLFTNTSTASSGNTITGYTWTFGDGNSSNETNTSHTFSGFNSYPVQLQVLQDNGCTNSATQYVVLEAFNVAIQAVDQVKPGVDLTNTNSLKACMGLVQFVSSGSIAKYYTWDIGNDGSIELEGEGLSKASITKTFTEPGVYPVKLTASNSFGCSNFVVDTVEVEEVVVIGDLPSQIFSCDLDDIHQLSITTTPAVDSITWKINESAIIGVNATSIQTTFPEGIHSLNISTITENNCIATQTIDSFIEVEVPRVSISYVSKNSGCIPLNISLIGTYNYNPQTKDDSIVAIEWDFDGDNIADITNSVSASPTYNTTGTHFPRFTVTTQQGCISSAAYTIYAGDPTTINYSITPQMCTWENAEFEQLTDLNPLSTADTLWYWLYSSDDTTRMTVESTPISPPGDIQNIHFDDTTGYFNIAIVVSDHGCISDTLFNDSVINVNGPIVFIDRSIDCNTPFDQSFFSSKLIDADSISWNVYKYDTVYPYGAMNHPIPDYQLITSNTGKVDPFNYTFTERGDYLVEAISNNYTYPQCADTAILTWVPVRDLVSDFELSKYAVCKGDLIEFNNDSTNNAQDMIATGVALKYADTTLSGNLTSNENKKNISYSTAQEYVYYTNKGTANVWLYTKDINDCIDSVSKPIFVYQPQPGFEITNPSNCLPFIAEFTDTSHSDAAIVERIWQTQGDTNTFDVGNKTLIADSYSTIGKKSPNLTVIDEYGCSNVFSIANAIVPIVPDARFSFTTEKVCLGGDVSITIPADTSVLLSKPIDSIQWYIDGVYFCTSLNGDAPNIYTPTTSGTKSFNATAYAQSPNLTCIHSIQESITIKDIAVRLPFNGTNICKGASSSDAILWLNDSIYYGLDDVKSIKWYVDGVYYPTAGNYAENIRLDKDGIQNLKMTIETDYRGCEYLGDSIDVFLHNRDVTMSLDKDTICVGETVTLNLSNQTFIETVPHYWLLGNGDRIDGSDSEVKYTYSSLPDVQNLTVKFKVDENAAENTSSCIDIAATASLMIYPTSADFTRGIADDVIVGCVPLTVDLINTSSGTDNDYVWLIDTDTDTNKNVTYTFEEPGKTYNIQLQLRSSNCTQTKTKTITTYPAPELTLIVDDTVVCNYDTVNIFASGNYTAINHWEWYGKTFGLTNNVLTGIYDRTTYVAISVQSVDECTFRDSVKVHSQYEPYYTGAPAGGLLYLNKNGIMDTLYDEQSERLIVNEIFNFNNDSLPGVKYRWSATDYLSCEHCFSPDIDLSCNNEFGSSNCLTIPDELTYTVYMTDSLNCYQDISETIRFEVIKSSRLGMPTAFSPNGDGLNDIAYARGWAVVDFIEMQIYNRWGQMIFETTDMSVGWNGTYNGQEQKPGSYAYIIKGIDTSGDEFMEKGFITLIR